MDLYRGSAASRIAGEDKNHTVNAEAKALCQRSSLVEGVCLSSLDMSSLIATSYRQFGHSADVKMHLEVEGDVLSLAQLGPDFVILRTSVERAPCDAVLSFSLGGQVRRREVPLPEGISAASPAQQSLAADGRSSRFDGTGWVWFF